MSEDLPGAGRWQTWVTRARALTEWFIIDEWRRDAELARRARLITNLGLLGFLFGCFYATFYLAISHYWGTGIIVVCSLAFVATPFFMRAVRAPQLAGNVLPGIMLIGFTALCCVEGGLNGHAIGWLAGVPLWAVILSGKTSAKWWALACLIVVGGMVLLAESGIIFKPTYNLGWETIVTGLGDLGLIVFIFILGIIFENGRRRALQQLHEALENLEESNRQLTVLNNEKTEFLGIAAHDLKNPLSTIIMGAQIIKTPASTAQIHRAADNIVDAGQRMRDLISNLLDANAIEQGRYATKLERCDLQALAEKSLENNRAHAARKEIALEIPTDGESPARADADATVQILDNLISNAIKYSPPKSTVRIRTFSEAGRAGVAVSDEGPGISEADRKKMFGKFTRLSARPTGGESSNGLGLSIVKRLAETMSGSVECESELGAGSTFILRLPQWADSTGAPANSISNRAESAPPLRKEAAPESARLGIVLTTVFVNIVATGLLAFAPWSDWKTGAGLNLVDNFLLLAFILRWRDPLLARFLLFGVVVGFAELPADAWLVDHTHTLDYSIGGGPMLWRSPVWMPFAWEIVAVQFGYLGLRLWERFRGWGLVAVGVLGAINIPYYEEMARHIHWWRYRNCPMLSFTPYYIIIGELGIALLLTLLARRLREAGWRTPVLAGLIAGAGIFVCYAIAFWLTSTAAPRR
jgi:signal transduction histidine kinase